MTIRDTTNSFQSNFLLKIIGSINPTNIGVVANITRATLTVLTFIDSKNKIQCMPTTNPTPAIFSKSRPFIFANLPLKTNHTRITSPPRVVLQNTNGIESIVINFPSIPVNPKINTTRCRSIWCLVSAFTFKP